MEITLKLEPINIGTNNNNNNDINDNAKDFEVFFNKDNATVKVKIGYYHSVIKLDDLVEITQILNEIQTMNYINARDHIIEEQRIANA